MNQVEIKNGETAGELEESVNEFLNSVYGEVYDIKYTVTYLGEDILFSAMIIYCKQVCL